jgi:hypothetical protein
MPQEMKLEPCPNPWCDDRNVLGVEHREGGFYRVACTCGIAGPPSTNEDQAIAAWNTRALPTRDAVLEEAAAYVEAQARGSQDIFDLISVQSDLPISEPTFSCEGLRQIAAAIRALKGRG